MKIKQSIVAMRYLVSSIAVTLALTLVCFAQQTMDATKPGTEVKEYPKTRIDGMVLEWTRAKDYTREYLDAMPEEGINFKPTPAIRSFAEQMLHLANANYGFAASAFGVTNPVQGKRLETLEELKTKTALTKAVMDSYDFMISTIKAQSDAKLDERAVRAGMNRPKSALLAAAFEHQTHHRGQTTIYLRLKGVTPPNEKLF
ncbi:MAG TPA: DinB family protein [Blastocatellia bacterium]|nr:DinB family protein [Blastocatellia bacterium]